MKRLLIGLLTAVWLITPTALSDDHRLLDDLGGSKNLWRIVDRTIDLAIKDPLTGKTFSEKLNVRRLKIRVYAQLCQLSGGDCTYNGPNMRKAHGDLDINMSMFNRFVEHLQQALRETDVPFRTQNQLLAKLAPMYDDVVGN